jgi:hypothetical protein
MKYLTEIGWEGVDCIYVAQDSDKWPVVVTAVGKFGFHKSRGTLWAAENI